MDVFVDRDAQVFFEHVGDVALAYEELACQVVERDRLGEMVINVGDQALRQMRRLTQLRRIIPLVDAAIDIQDQAGDQQVDFGILTEAGLVRLLNDLEELRLEGVEGDRVVVMDIAVLLLRQLEDICKVGGNASEVLVVVAADPQDETLVALSGIV